MKEPQPEDFGLSRATLNGDVAKEKERTSRLGQVGCVVALAFAILVGLITSSVGMNGAVAFFYVALVLSLALPVVLQGIGTALSPMASRIKAYQGEKAKYDAWRIRQQREWWFGLTGLAFEREMAALIRKMKYSVELTPASGDGGVDLIISDGTLTTAVQCKAHRNPVGPAVVRELLGVLAANSRFKRGLLIALGGITTGARQFAVGKNIEIWTIDDVIRHAGGANVTPEVHRPAPQGNAGKVVAPVDRQSKPSDPARRPPDAQAPKPLVELKAAPSAYGYDDITKRMAEAAHPLSGGSTVKKPAEAEAHSHTVTTARPQEGIQWKGVASSNIRAVGYRASDSTLFVRFTDQSVYQYSLVTSDVALAFMMADSHGKFLHANIKGKYESKRI